MGESPNFSFLEDHAPQLVRLGTFAERYFREDPNTCIMKLRQFAEVMTQLTAANLRVYIEDDDRQVSVLARLRDDSGITKGVLDLFHQVSGGSKSWIRALWLSKNASKINGKLVHIHGTLRVYHKGVSHCISRRIGARC